MKITQLQITGVWVHALIVALKVAVVLMTVVEEEEYTMMIAVGVVDSVERGKEQFRALNCIIYQINKEH